MGRPDFDEEATSDELDGVTTDSSLGYAYFGAREDEDAIKLVNPPAKDGVAHDAEVAEDNDGAT